MMKTLVAAAQMTATADKVANLEKCARFARLAKERGAKMLFLPEAFDYISGSKEEAIALAESLDGAFMTGMRRIAQRESLWLSLGGFHEKHAHTDKLGNAHIIIDDRGELVAQYRKLHLFDIDIKGGVSDRESDRAIAGEGITPPVATPAGAVGLGICYDLRFPELSLALRRQGAQILTYPAAFTVPTGADHWEVLLRARAIETQCYVVAAAQTGRHNPVRESFGHTMIIDPWGAVIAQCSRGEGLCYAEIDTDFIETVRTQMPVQQHRRTDVYPQV